MSRGWIGVDFDGTLAVFVGNYTNLGPPIPLMLQRVKDMIARGRDVRIFTARISHQDLDKKAAVIEAIEQWCVTHIGKKLPVTNVKDFQCEAIYDDKAYNVQKNTGKVLTRYGYK